MTGRVGEYLHYLALEKNASPNTIVSYKRDLQRYMRFLDAERVVTPDRITVDVAARFLQSLQADGLAPRSVTRALSALRGFHRFLLADGIVRADPTETLESPRKARTLPSVLTREEVDQILEQPAPAKGDRKNLWVRDRAILEVLYATGIRVSELITLKQAEVYAEEGIIRVFGKGSKERLVPIGPSALRWIERYRSETRILLARRIVAQDALFLNMRGHLAYGAAVCTAGGRDTRSTSAYVPSFVRNTPARRGSRPPGRAGNARSRGYLDYAGLHAYRPFLSEAGIRHIPPAQRRR